MDRLLAAWRYLSLTPTQRYSDLPAADPIEKIRKITNDYPAYLSLSSWDDKKIQNLANQIFIAFKSTPIDDTSYELTKEYFLDLGRSSARLTRICINNIDSLQASPYHKRVLKVALISLYTDNA